MPRLMYFCCILRPNLNVPEILIQNIFPQIKAVQKETGIKGKNLFMPIRIAVSGEMHGPELPETIFLLGREKSIKHIDQVLATL